MSAYTKIESFLSQKEMDEMYAWAMEQYQLRTDKGGNRERAWLADYPYKGFSRTGIMLSEPGFEIGWHKDDDSSNIRKCAIIHPIWPVENYPPCQTQDGNTTDVILLDVCKPHNVNNDTDQCRINLQIEFLETYDTIKNLLLMGFKI